MSRSIENIYGKKTKDNEKEALSSFESDVSSINNETKEKLTDEKLRNISFKDLRKYIEINPQTGKMEVAGRSLAELRFYNLVSEEVENQFNEIFVEQIKKNQEKLFLLKEIFRVWGEAALKKRHSLWFKRFRTSDFSTNGLQELSSSDFDNMGDVDGVENALKYANISLENCSIFLSEKDFKKQIEKIFFYIKEGEKKEEIIGIDDMFGKEEEITHSGYIIPSKKGVKDIFFDESLNIEEKRLKIFDLMRYGGWSGNSEGVKDIIADNILFEQKKGENGKIEYIHKDILELLNSRKIQEILDDYRSDFSPTSTGDYYHGAYNDYRFTEEHKNNTVVLEKLKKALGKPYDILASDIIKIYSRTRDRVELKYKKEYKIFLKNNEKVYKENGLKTKNITFKTFLWLNKIDIDKITFDTEKIAFKHLLLRKKIEIKKNRGDEKNSLMGMYADMSGLAEKKSRVRDFFDYSDENIDNLIDFSLTVAMGLATMGGGMLATGLVRAGTGALFRTATIANRLNSISKLKYGSTILKGGKFLGNSISEGIFWHLGATGTSNILFGEKGDSVFEGFSNKHALFESIAFMGVLNSFGSFRSLLNSRRLKALEEGKKLSKLEVFAGKVLEPQMKIPDELLQPGVIKSILEKSGTFVGEKMVEGGTLFTISGIVEEFIGDGWNPTLEEYLHFLALVSVLHFKDIGMKGLKDTKEVDKSEKSFNSNNFGYAY